MEIQRTARDRRGEDQDVCAQRKIESRRLPPDTPSGATAIRRHSSTSRSSHMRLLTTDEVVKAMKVTRNKKPESRTLMTRLLSVNVGLPRDIAWRGKTVHTANLTTGKH